jgi:hypothetical protein
MSQLSLLPGSHTNPQLIAEVMLAEERKYIFSPFPLSEIRLSAYGFMYFAKRLIDLYRPDISLRYFQSMIV